MTNPNESQLKVKLIEGRHWNRPQIQKQIDTWLKHNDPHWQLFIKACESLDLNTNLNQIDLKTLRRLSLMIVLVEDPMIQFLIDHFDPKVWNTNYYALGDSISEHDLNAHDFLLIYDQDHRHVTHTAAISHRDLKKHHLQPVVKRLYEVIQVDPDLESPIYVSFDSENEEEMIIE